MAGGGHAAPALRSLFLQVACANQLNGAVMRNGVYELGLQAYWSSTSIALDRLVRRYRDDPSRMRDELIALIRQVDQLPVSGYETLPLSQMAGLREAAPFFYEWMAEPVSSDLWRQLNIAARYAEVSAPSYHLGGWYDIFLDETLRGYMAMRRREGPAATTKLLIGPWAHVVMGNLVGEIDFGFASSSAFLDYRGDLTDLQLRWFDATIKNERNGILEEDPVTLFVMGENRWRTFADWPPPEAREQVWYLDSAGHANTRYGDGTLTLQQPAQGITDHYTYDPADPTPTRGGALLMPAIFPRGPRDQSVIEERPDVLCYTSAALDAALAAIGPVRVRLYAASSAVDTDFVARLVDVHPDGRAYTLTDGVQRASYHQIDLAAPSDQRPRLIEPHRAYQYDIDLWATAHVFRAGHRIRLEVTSSNFPRWDRNLNTGRSGTVSSEMRVARQSILHESEHPSALYLAILPQG